MAGSLPPACADFIEFLGQSLGSLRIEHLLFLEHADLFGEAIGFPADVEPLGIDCAVKAGREEKGEQQVADADGEERERPPRVPAHSERLDGWNARLPLAKRAFRQP